MIGHPLVIIQARLASTRLPNKMLCDLGGQTLIQRAWGIACEAFGEDDCVVAIPKGDEDGPLGAELDRIGANVFAWDGDTADVLGRFHACAHTYRWKHDAVLLRITPDDPFKSAEHMWRVVNGERLPVELGGEAFTLAMLDAANEREELWTATVIHGAERNRYREHITHALFPFALPPIGIPGYTVDTQTDLDAARAMLGHCEPIIGGTPDVFAPIIEWNHV
jgi:spore coat polysaccharide biosynthesis protein SpsF (cytidylyltransferase family)